MPSADSRERLKKNQVTQMAKTLDPKILAGLSKMNKANESETRRLRNAAGRRLSSKKPDSTIYRSSEQKQERGTINPSSVGDAVSTRNPNSITNKLGRTARSASRFGSRMGEKLQNAGKPKTESSSSNFRSTGRNHANRQAAAKEILSSDKSASEKLVELRKLGYREDTSRNLIKKGF